jgi:ribonuclease Y
MNGAREVHVEVNNKKIQERELEALSSSIAKKIESDVAFPGEVKILVTRRFEATAVA